MIVCANCNRTMRIVKNGVEFIEMAGPDPYKLWSSDMWECQDCGARILFTNALQHPIAEHYEPGFSERAKKAEYRAKEWSSL